MTGGSIIEVSIAGRTFTVPSDSAGDPKLGGFENEIQANGDASAREIKTRVPWSIEELTVGIDNTTDDQEYLQAIADSPGWKPITITFASNATYQGTGTIMGEIKAVAQSATASISLSGPGKLTRQ